MLDPLLISHVGPVIGIEARGVLDQLFFHFHGEALVDRVERQRFPGHGEQFLAQAQHAFTNRISAQVDLDDLRTTLKVMERLVEALDADEWPTGDA